MNKIISFMIVFIISSFVFATEGEDKLKFCKMYLSQHYANPFSEWNDPEYQPLFQRKILEEKGILKPFTETKIDKPSSFTSFSKKHIYGFDIVYKEPFLQELKVTKAKKDISSTILHEIYITFKYKNGYCYVDTEKTYKGGKDKGKLVKNYSFDKCLEFKRKISKGINNGTLYKKYTPNERRELSKCTFDNPKTSTHQQIEALASNTHKLSKALFRQELKICDNYHTHYFFQDVEAMFLNKITK